MLYEKSHEMHLLLIQRDGIKDRTKDNHFGIRKRHQGSGV